MQFLWKKSLKYRNLRDWYRTERYIINWLIFRNWNRSILFSVTFFNLTAKIRKLYKERITFDLPECLNHDFYKIEIPVILKITKIYFSMIKKLISNIPSTFCQNETVALRILFQLSPLLEQSILLFSWSFSQTLLLDRSNRQKRKKLAKQKPIYCPSCVDPAFLVVGARIYIANNG